MEFLRREVQELRESHHNVRRGMFARQNELAKLFLELRDQLERIEHGIKPNRNIKN